MKRKLFFLWLGVLSAFSSCGTSVSTTGMTREEMIGLADLHFANGSWSQASLVYTEMQFRFPGDELYDLFLFRGAVCDREMHLWADAEFNFYRVVNEFPRGAWADDAQLAIAETMWRQRRDHRRDPAPVLRAREELQTFIERYPGSDLMDQAIALLGEVDEHLSLRALDTGRFYLRRDKPEAAVLYLREAIENHPQASCKAELLITMGDAYLAMGNSFSARSYYRRARDECDLTPAQMTRVEENLSEDR